jgi:hypothetical protein
MTERHKRLSKRKFVGLLEAKLKDGYEGHSTYQERPWTCVVMNISLDVIIKGERITHRYEVYGFSKVQWPDKWDEQEGVGVAITKGLRRFARQIANGEIKGLEAWSYDTYKRISTTQPEVVGVV